VPRSVLVSRPTAVCLTLIKVGNGGGYASIGWSVRLRGCRGFCVLELRNMSISANVQIGADGTLVAPVINSFCTLLAEHKNIRKARDQIGMTGLTVFI
jgi:hypothetical protein